MSLRTLSIAPPLVSLFFLSTYVVAEVNVTAICTSPSFSWTFNSLYQSPCMVAAYMLATCNGGSYTLAPLSTGIGYESPTRESSNKCQCSTVGYSLISACIACQEWDPSHPCSWFDYVANCTDGSILPPSQFPNPVPPEIRVPYWAILDVTNENYWDPYESCAAVDKPEFGPGAIFSPSGVYTSSPSAYSTSAYSASTSSTIASSVSVSSSSASSLGASSTTPPTTSNSGSHASTIGIVLGSTAIVSIAVGASLYLLARRIRTQAASPDVGASQSMPNDGAVAQLVLGPPQTMTYYDPNDPTTFPGYPASAPSLDVRSDSQLSSRVGPRSTQLEDIQTSLPHARGYHGLPMPSA